MMQASGKPCSCQCEEVFGLMICTPNTTQRLRSVGSTKAHNPSYIQTTAMTCTNQSYLHCVGPCVHDLDSHWDPIQHSLVHRAKPPLSHLVHRSKVLRAGAARTVHKQCMIMSIAQTQPCSPQQGTARAACTAGVWHEMPVCMQHDFKLGVKEACASLLCCGKVW